MKKLQKLLSILIVLAMIVSVAPAVFAEGEDVTVYLKPSSNWLEGGARFAVYYFNDGGNGWVDMSDSGNDGFYRATVPAGNKIIFCRMNPNAAANNWDNKWNQTADLALPADSSNCFYAPEGAWDGATADNWGTLDVAPEVTEPEFTAYTVAGEEGLCGKGWDETSNPMTETSTGIWSITFSNISAGSYQFKVTDGTWNNSWGVNGGQDNMTVTVTETSNVTITFNADTKEITVDVQPTQPGVTPPEETDPPVVTPENYTVKLHFLPDGDWGDTVNAWLWAGVDSSLPGYEEYHLSWPGKAVDANAEHEGWYDLTVVTNNAAGFKFIFNDGHNQTSDLQTGTLSGDVEIWQIGEKRYYYAPEAWTGVPTYTYTIHFHNVDNWAAVNAYAWVDSDKLLGDWAGTSAAATKGNDGWYTVTFAAPYNAVNVIFNDGNGSQTSDLAVAAPSEDRNVQVWVDNGNVTYSAPESWTEVIPGNTVKIHFMPPYVSWGKKIYAWLWSGNGDVPGYEAYHKYWPGMRVEEDVQNPGWYYLEVTTELNGFNFIFSGLRQTGDLYVGNITGDMEIWVYGNDIYTAKPDVLPATGDTTNVVAYAAVLLMSVAALAYVLGKKKVA